MILKQQNVKPRVCCKIPIKPYQKSPKIYWEIKILGTFLGLPPPPPW
jgi:hypothetical protein